ncbi:unnamed protein product, partial [Ectocarpus sp. 12 AP-2014]
HGHAHSPRPRLRRQDSLIGLGHGVVLFGVVLVRVGGANLAAVALFLPPRPSANPVAAVAADAGDAAGSDGGARACGRRVGTHPDSSGISTSSGSRGGRASST